MERLGVDVSGEKNLVISYIHKFDLQNFGSYEESWKLNVPIILSLIEQGAPS